MHVGSLLKCQHHDAEKLLGTIERSHDEAAKLAAFEELATLLVAHDAAERDVFFPACNERLGLDEALHDALIDQGRVEFALYEAEQARGQPSFDYRIAMLREAFARHVREEEKRLLPRAESELDARVLEELGDKMETRFQKELVGDFRGPLVANLRRWVDGLPTTEGTSEPDPRHPRTWQ